MSSFSRNLSNNPPASNNAVVLTTQVPKTTLAPGQTTQATAEVFIDGVRNPTALVAWTSSDLSIATVSSTGLISAVAANSLPVTITASHGSAVSRIFITVSAPGGGGGGNSIVIKQGSQTVTGGSIALTVGGSTTLSAVLVDSTGAQAPNQPVFSWNSSAGAVSVANGGLVIGNSVGVATVSAMATGYSAASVAVNVTSGGGGGALSAVRILQNGQNVTGLTLNLAQGSTLNLNAVGVDSNGTAVAQQPIFNWSPASGAPATVINGIVTGNSPGSQLITLSGGGFQASVNIVVASVGVSTHRIRITDASGRDVTGQTLNIPAQAAQAHTLTATLLDKNGNVLPDPVGGFGWLLNPAVNADFNCGAGCKSATFSINGSSGGKWLVEAWVPGDLSIVKSAMNFEVTTSSGGTPSIRIKRGALFFTGALNMSPNTSVTLTAEAYDGSGTKIPGQPTFNFVSNNSNISASNNLFNGTAIITATVPKQSGTVTVSATGFPSVAIPVQVFDNYFLQLKVNQSGNWSDPWLDPASVALNLNEKTTYLFNARVVDSTGIPPSGLTAPGNASYTLTAPNLAASTSALGTFRSDVPGTSMLTASVEFPMGSGLRIQNSVPLNFKANAGAFSIKINPPSTTKVSINGSMSLTAVLKDANGNLVTPSSGVSWSIISGNNNGSISSSGLSATVFGESCGPFTVEVSYSLSGSNQTAVVDLINLETLDPQQGPLCLLP